jgi:hypothetical protein
MPTFRIHRLRPHLRQHFRSAPHTSGKAAVKPRDYRADGAVEARNPYAAFFALRQQSQPLEVGDLLETPEGALAIFKYVGFEEAAWAATEEKAAERPESPEARVPGA